jgi:microsomal dipeptidase-like Zn-dependent dipeptidase
LRIELNPVARRPGSGHTRLPSRRRVGYVLGMAKTKQSKRLYSRMRAGGVRKKIARQLSELPGHVSGGKRAPKPLREAVERLEAAVVELKDHSRRGDRKAAARKAARTRRAKAQSRSSAARKGVRRRTKA